MKQLYILIFLFLMVGSTYGATGDTAIVTAHTSTQLNSPPSDDDVWVVIPNTGLTYQKVLLKFTLGCGQPNCSGWDYTVNTQIGKKDGSLDSTIIAIDTLTLDTSWVYSDHVEFIEIGRLITPYGTYMANNSNGFNNSWTHPYYYDVTDYAALLEDSVNVRVHYDGWTDAFSAKIEFIFIEGPPTRTVENIREIYHTYIGYPDRAGFESVATAKTFPIAPNVTSAKVTINMTGHGNQGEFDPHYFHLKINGSEIYQHILWKDDCDINAIAPQGGTWIFHRANWCPGEKVPIYEVDITPYITPGQNVTIDLDFDDFTIQNNASAGYGTSVHLITYTSQKDNDAMMEEIIAPNNDKPYLHWNPISTSPKIKIKNMGQLPLTYAEISYWVKGGTKWYYEWYGNILPFESATIILPAFDWNGLDTTDIKYYAEVNWPNQTPDEYVYNNLLESSFNMTPKLDSIVVINFNANNRPEENWYIVRNESGDTVAFRNSFTASTYHRDTLRLSPGSYTFDFNDYDAVNWGCGDGLRFFVNQQNPPCPTSSTCYETTGQINLRRLNNTIIKNFSNDFGANIHYEFTVGYPLGFNEPKTAPEPPVHNTNVNEMAALTAEMNVFPNPGQDQIQVSLNLSKPTSGTLVLTDLTGKTVKAWTVNHVANYTHHINCFGVNRGFYFVKFVSTEISICKKIVLQ